LKPTSDVDVEVLLSEVVGGAKKLTSLVEIFEEEGNCVVKPKQRIARMVWVQINNKVREWSGKWDRKMQAWTVPLK